MELEPQPRSFTLFPDLPVEIRLKIWSFIAPSPRTVSIKYKGLSFNSIGKGFLAAAGWRSPDPVPIILHICQESRTEALKSYQLAFGLYLQRGHIYFDFSKDTLRFGNSQGDAYMTVPEMLQSGPIDYMLDVFLGGEFYGAEDAEKVQYMITDIDESVYGRRAFCWDEIRLFTGLKELTIMPWDEDEMADELMRGYRDTLKNVANGHPEWVVPRITVVSATSGTLWGTLEVESSG
ncbi:hypothetical protein N431DRAFT_424799 [Stipitochalara longipes BDJ]|nr:hypothetical protein N431DRAFT_424799 [Stipitochalara longipes BDJ]